MGSDQTKLFKYYDNHPSDTEGAPTNMISWTSTTALRDFWPDWPSGGPESNTKAGWKGYGTVQKSRLKNIFRQAGEGQGGDG
jgi:hypothetical protein